SLLSAEPALAQTNLESFGQSVLNLLSNGLLRTVAILAIIAAGFGWLTGRVNTGALVTVIIGIALIFSAPWIVDQLNAG
ncbi:TrbC/VirB2 family protein, partial [Novosphingobium sp. NRRL B-2648]